MIVFDLQCRHNHVFEAWFADSADFERQKKRGLLECPICGDTEIGKAVMAPAVGRKGNQKADQARLPVAAPSQQQPDAGQIKAALKAMAEMQAKFEAVADHVGEDFADEARRIHYGESPDRPIIGEATLADARELHEEGIEVMPLPFQSRRKPKALQ